MSRVPMLPRRAVLAGALAPLAGNLPTAATAAEVTPTILELRRLIPLAHAAIALELDLEGRPGYAEACARSEALEAEIEALATSIWAKPAQTWGDCIARAELAGFWASREWDWRLTDLSSESPDARAMAELLEAVLTLGARHV